MPGSDTTTEQFSPHDGFNQKVAKVIKDQGIKTDPKDSYLYTPKAAEFMYRGQAFESAYKNLDDDFGFFDWISTRLPQEFTPQTVTDLIKAARVITEKNDTAIGIVDPVSEISSKPKELKIPYRDGTIGVKNTMQRKFKGLHISDPNERHFFDFEGKNFNHPDYVNFYLKTRAGPAIILINSEELQLDPTYALVSLAHEIGHEVEALRLMGTKIKDGKLNINAGIPVDEVAPKTEVVACLYGYKMARMIWDITRSEAALASAARQMERYNFVVFGNSNGDKVPSTTELGK